MPRIARCVAADRRWETRAIWIISAAMPTTYIIAPVTKKTKKWKTRGHCSDDATSLRGVPTASLAAFNLSRGRFCRCPYRFRSNWHPFHVTRSCDTRSRRPTAQTSPSPSYTYNRAGSTISRQLDRDSRSSHGRSFTGVFNFTRSASAVLRGVFRDIAK